MNNNPYPSLYQVNTRVWLTELSRLKGQTATLDDIPDHELDRLSELGFSWLWFLSVWETGETGKSISREYASWRKDFEETLPDLKEEDIAGSGFAIKSYRVHPAIGGDEALARLRERMNRRGLKLMLDFVPNHMGPDHPWVDEHPEYFIAGTASDLKNYPQNYMKVKPGSGNLIIAHGRDPYFDGWPDTIQLDYSKPAAAKAMLNELIRISGQCDGVRCDMAMLILPEVFERTWGRKAKPFWPGAIKAIRDQNPGFCFMAEVYWEMEWVLQQQGFDYTYDKKLYDRLDEGDAKGIREHFYAEPAYQDKLVRFLENHDESRAATRFSHGKHEAAAVITYLSPGLRFFHQGQFEGKTKRISPHLVRGPLEDVDGKAKKFYNHLLGVLKMPLFRDGRWNLLEAVPAWDGNESWDSFLAFSWEGRDNERAIIAVNYSPNSGQCYIYLPFKDIERHQVQLTDLVGTEVYDRDGSDLLARGLYLDMPGWGYHVFTIKKTG